MAEFIHADSLAFVSIDGLYRAVGAKERDRSCPQYCDACFTGDYPTSLTDLADRNTPDLLSLKTEEPA
jgi:amidophosphoribosyltransferase